MPFKKGERLPLESIEKSAATRRGRKLSPKHLENMSKALKGRKLSKQWRENLSFSQRKKNNSFPIDYVCRNCDRTFVDFSIKNRKFCSQICSVKFWIGKKRPRKVGLKIAKAHADGRYIEGNHRKPTKPELILKEILDINYPNDYEYVGDGKIVIGSIYPDFINKNGRKEVIELYGDYWHRNDNPQDRIDRFAKLGFKCLVIWEHELGSTLSLTNKITKWRNSK